MALNLTRPRNNLLDKPLSKGKSEVSFSCFSLLFSELVQYSQSKSNSITELHERFILLYKIFAIVF